MFRENLQQTIKFVLTNVFNIIDVIITKQLRQFYKICSTLFEFLLFQFERENERENNDFLLIQKNQDHYNVFVLRRLLFKHCR